MNNKIIISATDGRGRVLTGISPRHGSHAALFIACDAFNARTVTTREYHCADLCVIARKPPRPHYGVVFVARSQSKQVYLWEVMAHKPPGSA